MKSIRLSLLLSGLVIFAFSLNAQTFNWARSIKSEGFDEGYDLVTDPNGYVYVAGQIEFLTDFGNNLIIESVGVHDIFLAKYTPLGDLVWARRAGGRGGDKIQSITLDGQGHIFVTGEVDDTAYIENIMLTTGGRGINNMFIGKYDTSGSVLWARHIMVDGPPNHTRGYGITTDPQGNVYACGGLIGDAYYNGNFLFSSEGSYDGTIVKFDPNGNFCWMRRMGGSDSDKAYGIICDNNGSLYVTGYFVGNADFGPGFNLNGSGHTDIFLAKFDTAGFCQWVVQAGDTGFDRSQNIDINVNGDILITGFFQTGYFGQNRVNSRGHEDMFLAAYDSNGDNLWALGGGGPENDAGRGVTHDASGNIYVIGDYANTGQFPPYSITSNGFADVFVAKYNSSGTAVDWVRSFGGNSNDRGRGIGTDPNNNVYITGEYQNGAQLDSFYLAGHLNFDIFVARIGLGHFCSAQVSSVVNNTCNNTCDGSAIALSTGQSPFSFSWSTNPVQQTATATNLCAGDYTVTITDNFGCSATATVTVTEPPLIQLTSSLGDISCHGSCDGLAIANASGLGPFTFSWNTSPVQTDSIAINLCAGDYDVVATDAAGCTATKSVSISEPSAITMTVTIQNANCIGCSNGDIDIHVNGGTGSYQFAWSNGSSNQDQHNITAGTYSVCVTDVNNCSLCDTFTVVQPTLGIVDITSDKESFIYPNPVTSSATLHINPALIGSTQIMVLNSIGEKVFETAFGGNDFELNGKVFEAGVYFVRLYNKNSNWENVISFVVE